MSQDSGRAFILGLDGVPWSLIDQWTADGHLPNFARLVDEGVGCPLRSTTPATTPLAWPSIATGVRPDKHGIYGFQAVTAAYTHRMNDNTAIQQPALWDLLSPSVVANVPMTYPAPPIDGKLVAGIMAPEIDERYTHPSSLAAEITRTIPEYEISLRWGEYVDREQALFEDITSLVEARRKLMEMLMETDDWELFFFTYVEPDRLQHLVWDEDILRQHYEQLDDVLAEVMDYVEDRGATLYVVSDHGFGPVSRSVAVNSVLEHNGYLQRDQSTAQSTLARVGVTKAGIASVLNRIGLDPYVLARKYVPIDVVDAIASNIPGEHALYDLDHGRTRAFVHGFGNVYINDAERFQDGPVDPHAVGEVKRELTALFGNLTDPETGRQALTVRDGEELFPTDSRSPDLVLEPEPGFVLSKSFSDEIFGTPEANASHRPDGIFFAWGEHVDPHADLDEASVVDVAPTVLHGVSRPIPENADGSVLAEIFSDETPPAQAPVEERVYAKGGQGERGGDSSDMHEVKDRLQGLGYLE